MNLLTWKSLKMFIDDIIFKVELSTYAEKHFCKSFLKKYKTKKWLETRRTIFITLERAFSFQNTTLLDNIKFAQENNAGIFKLDFRVAGTNSSPKKSGNRVVFFLCNNTGHIKILLVYGKDHCQKKSSETQWILNQIKNNFPEYKTFC